MTTKRKFRKVQLQDLVESSFKNGLQTIERKALALAAEDGIPWAVVLGSEWVNFKSSSPP